MQEVVGRHEEMLAMSNSRRPLSIRPLSIKWHGHELYVMDERGGVI